ncbi:tRNA pseudouridine synthase [Achlya hypogyna]|uniref:tRNA pseudouridine synthase n=1 Tax=Achlya hypogyna TaxID=1202772 RepID=A0A1V9ZRE9_ACHHY|nr:tRNA pseudouridine synthase [Achlya hypogyna]
MAIHPVRYEEFTKDELLQVIRRLRDSPDNLAHAVDTAARAVRSGEPSAKKQKKLAYNQKPPKPFDFSRYRTRHIALKFSYAGEKYAGFARQEHMEHTIERYLIDALLRARMVEDFNNCGYSRCGRTDAGVSALGQVVGLIVRSNVPADAIILDDKTIDDIRPNESFRVQLPDGTIKTLMELDYCVSLNSALPADIRVYGWAPAPMPEWSARFHCIGRVYKYFFHRRNMDLERMREAAALLVGVDQDYRNFCRLDPSVPTYTRSISSFKVHETTPADSAGGNYYQLCYLEIHGKAFLWHQVRCMAAILFLVGRGLEQPALVTQLLDVNATPRKPQYEMASELPLVLHDCKYDTMHMTYTPGVLNRVYCDIESQWEAASLRTAMLRNQLETLKEITIERGQALEEVQKRLKHLRPDQVEAKVPVVAPTDGKELLPFGSVWPSLPPAGKGLKHIPIMQRRTGHSVEEKLQKSLRKRMAKELSAENSEVEA